MRVFCNTSSSTLIWRQIHPSPISLFRPRSRISICSDTREFSNCLSLRTPVKSACVSSKFRSQTIDMPASSVSNGDHVRPVLQFAKLTDKAKAPTRGSENAAGYDLYSAVAAVIPAKGKAIVNTDIQIAVPDGCYGRVAPRSGLAVKNFIDVGAGVIDHDYRGNVGVVMFNFSDTDFEVKEGDRIAQLICEKIFYPDIEELSSLSKTARGSGGYGSTGTN